MSKAEYALLQDVLMDADFPDLDLALRRGRHVDRDDAAWYSLLSDAQELLEPFYRRYGCELIHKTDGYFYLLPTGDKVSRKQLAATDMLVGQALALLYLDPAAVERGGVVSQEEVVSQLSAVLGSDALIGVFSPGKRKVKDERIAQRNVRQRVGEAVRRLGGLGFVEVSDENAVRLRAALLRFAEPVRGLSEPAEALAKLVAQGEVALTPDELAEAEDSSSAELDDDSLEAPEPTGVVAARGAPDLAPIADAAAAAEGGTAGSDSADEEAGDGLVAPASADEEAGGLGAAPALAEREVDLSGDELFDADSARMGDTLAGIGAPSAEDEGYETFDFAAAADGGESEPAAESGEPEPAAESGEPEPAAESGDAERSVVVRKPPREPVDSEDLDWADILVPEPDAEDGS